ncbi:hypothetical protein [Streptomyces sp. ITFR-16]|uniref:hypothetical protein n=1 Tax=Streptomyces sp. ITFR-16 TaxID=3075198 RepID=UPI00288BF496|nr:hypothetical protein [Streptomyces sp. ITFR-16]WNI23497.1 hypothetical protein RLT58_16905 [Streptomyces sp. ITFR-16]
MGRITDQDRQHNETAIRAAMDRLLAGDLPEDSRRDIKTLAAMAGVTRTGFYPKKNRDGSSRPGPYQHLAEEFSRRLLALEAAGQLVDPRAAQIDRLQAHVGELKERVAERNMQISGLTEFKQRALSRIAAQHQEIERLRAQIGAGSKVTPLPR